MQALCRAYTTSFEAPWRSIGTALRRLTRLAGIIFHPAMGAGAKLQQGNYKLAVTEECREAIAAAKRDDPVTIDRSGKLMRFLDAQGRLLGTLTTRHAIAKEIDAGSTLVYCAVAWIYEASERYPFGLASARVHTGDPDDSHVKWCLANSWGKPIEPRPIKTYAVNIVGESFHQAAIGRCREGDRVVFYRELGNPHDPRAIVVKAADGSTIGHLPRSSWLQRVIHEEESGAAATIQALHPGPPTAVVLGVRVTGEDTLEVDYEPPALEPVQSAQGKGWISRLIGQHSRSDGAGRLQLTRVADGLHALKPNGGEMASDWKVGDEREVEPGRYLKLLAEEQGWPLWKTETAQLVQFTTAKAALGQPAAVILSGGAFQGGTPRIEINFAGRPQARLCGRLAYEDGSELRVVGARFMTRVFSPFDPLPYDGQKIEVLVRSAAGPRTRTKVAQEAGIIDLAGLSAIVTAWKLATGIR